MATLVLKEHCNVPEGVNPIFFVRNGRMSVLFQTPPVMYMLNGDHWDEVSGNHDILPPSCTIVQYGTSLIAIGGWEHGEPSKEVLVLNKRWTHSNIPNMIEGCCRACAVEVRGCLVVLGGRGSGPRLLDLAQVWNNKTMQWSKGQALPVASEDPSVAVHENNILVAGGWCMGNMIWCIQYEDLVRFYSVMHGNTFSEINHKYFR